MYTFDHTGKSGGRATLLVGAAIEASCAAYDIAKVGKIVHFLGCADLFPLQGKLCSKHRKVGYLVGWPVTGFWKFNNTER